MLLEDIKTARAPQNKSATELDYEFGTNPKLQQLGIPGYQATAYSHRDKPNTVVKVIEIKRFVNDPVMDFVNICMKHADNPFLPNIYTAKLYNTAKDSNRYNVLVITMEKLQPLRISNPYLYETSFHIFKQLKILPDVDDTDHPYYEYRNGNPKQLHDCIKLMFEEPENRDWLMQHTPHRKLAGAIKLLNPLFNEHYPDLHIDNLMMRLTGSGPQLVLMDPIVG